MNRIKEGFQVLAGLFGLLIFNMSYSQVSSKVSNLKDWGVIGNGKSDNTLKINKAIAFCAKNGIELVIDPGIYMINTSSFNSGVQCQSGSIIKFMKGAIFRGIPTSSSSYSILKVYNCSDVHLVNPTVEGDKVRHLGNDGEWGHGITVNNSRNVIIEGATISNCWGDGIYLGYDWHQKSFKYRNDNIRIIRANVSSCRRNGISICMGNNIYIESPIIKDIKGTLPEAAIDFEPEFSDPSSNKIQYDNIVVNNPQTSGSRYGLLFVLNIIRNRSTHIKIDKHIDRGSEFGCYFSETTPGVNSNNNNVVLNSPEWLNNVQNGMCMMNYAGVNSPNVVVKNPLVKNWNRGGYKGFPATAAIAILNTKFAVLKYLVGNVKIIGGNFELDSRPVWEKQAFPVGCSWGVPFKNVVIDNINQIKNAATWVSVPSKGILINDSKRVLAATDAGGAGSATIIGLDNFRKYYRATNTKVNRYQIRSVPDGSTIVFEKVGAGDILITSEFPILYNGRVFRKNSTLIGRATGSTISVKVADKVLQVIAKQGSWNIK